MPAYDSPDFDVGCEDALGGKRECWSECNEKGRETSHR